MSQRRGIVIAIVLALALIAGSFAVGYVVAGDEGAGVNVSRNSDGVRITIDGKIADGHGPRVMGEALEQILSQSVNPPSEDALVRGAIRGMVKVLKRDSDDPYALFYTPQAYENFQELTTGKFSGIGVWVEPDRKNFVIVSVLPGTPARRAGLEAGDIITTIDGDDVEGMTPDQAVGRIKGPAGTEVAVGVEREGEPLEFTITRASIELPNLRAHRTGDGFGYIRLFGFARGAGSQLRDRVDQMVDAGVEGIVLDMRDNGGGLFDEGIEVASVFIETGDVVIYREQNADDVVYEAEGEAYEDVPLVVLVNERTASASEIVAGALQDNERGIVVGSTTYGKGSVQQVVPLIDASALKLTTAAYLTPEGRNIDGRGIEPDVEVSNPSGQRSRAIEILRGIALSSNHDSQG
ncbi:MAG: S41 family peptidase [Actinomycetota bacterium]